MVVRNERRKSDHWLETHADKPLLVTQPLTGKPLNAMSGYDKETVIGSRNTAHLDGTYLSRNFATLGPFT